MRKINKEEARKVGSWLAIICLAILFYWFVENFTIFTGYMRSLINVMRPFIIGTIIAYLLFPVQNWFTHYLTKLFRLDDGSKNNENKRRFCNNLSIALALLVFFLLIMELVASVLPQTLESARNLVLRFPQAISKIETELNRLFGDNPEVADAISNQLRTIYEKTSADLLASINSMINQLVSGISSGLLSMLIFLKDFLIGIIVAAYIMSGRKTFKKQAKLIIKAMFPYKHDLEEGREQTADWIFREVSILNRYMNGFIKGKIIDSVVIGAICLIFCLIVSMPYAVLVSVIVGVTNIIPFFGPFIGVIPSSLIILLENPVQCVVFVIFIIVLQQIDGNLIGPHILGNATKLSPFWVLFAILLFGGLFGIPGMILGVPVFGFIYQLVREIIYKKIDRTSK